MKKLILIADGFFYDFVPLSLEKPKGLWEVKGEKLVERLIKQAKEAEINDISILIGYKSEMFSYLGEMPGISFIENDHYGEENGIEFLKHSGLLEENTVVCSSGDYYFDNPFIDANGVAEKEKAAIDTFQDLREFDSKYILYSGSQIIRNIRLVFRCEEDEVYNFRYIDRRQTNASFVFEIKGVNYIYRHPAEGIGELVSWKNEKEAMIIVKELGIDPTYIYADIREGWKIMEFIGPHGKPDYASFEDSKKIIKLMRKLHSADVVTDFGMRPWEDAEATIEALNNIDTQIFVPYKEVREKIKVLYEQTINDSVKKCFCHGDTYKPNWMMMPDESVILIDWEYAGYSDPGIDVGYYIVDADYDIDDAERFIREYLSEDYTDEKFKHFMIYTALIAYYWFIWALMRRAVGEPRLDIEEKYKQFTLKYAEHLSERYA